MICRVSTKFPEVMDKAPIDKDGVHYGSWSSIESNAIKVSYCVWLITIIKIKINYCNYN